MYFLLNIGGNTNVNMCMICSLCNIRGNITSKKWAQGRMHVLGPSENGFFVIQTFTLHQVLVSWDTIRRIHAHCWLNDFFFIIIERIGPFSISSKNMRLSIQIFYLPARYEADEIQRNWGLWRVCKKPRGEQEWSRMFRFEKKERKKDDLVELLEVTLIL